MTIKDLFEADFDINCNCKIYEKMWDDDTFLHATDNGDVPKELLNRKVSYITIHDRTLIVEIEKEGPK